MHWKKLFSPKYMRLLALGLILLGSLLFLLQSQYGSTELVAFGQVRPGAGKTVQFDVIASVPGDGPDVYQVSLSDTLRKALRRQGEDAEFLVVLNRRGKKMFFERIYVLSQPAEEALQGPKDYADLSLAAGVRPELVEMIGLDRYGYQLVPPIWARQKMPEAGKVYYQEGTFEAVKKILDGGGEFTPNLYILDAKSRIVGVRRTGPRLLTFSETLRLGALVSYLLALVVPGVAVIARGRGKLASWGKRIWDQVSRRRRKSTN